MDMTLRWFGEGVDSVSLEQIRQIPGVKGVITTLYDIPAGEVWPMERILQMKEQVESRGLKVLGIESVNIHDAIKVGTPDREQYIANYITTLERLGQAGIHVVCYNFMPVFDWTRSDLAKERPDGSTVLAYSQKEIDKINPENMFQTMGEKSNGFELPGWEPERMARIKELFDMYKDVDEDRLFNNLVYFLKAIQPVCEKYDIKMAIHPDDPAWPVFGLARIITGKEKLLKLMKAVDANFNGVTLCTGSLGSNPENDIPDIIRSLKGRIPYAHVRNLQYNAPGDFQEAAHLSEDGSMDQVVMMDVPTSVLIEKIGLEADGTTETGFLGGALIRIEDRRGREVYRFLSRDDAAHEVTGILKEGETYTAIEEEAPYGYERAEPVKFTVSAGEEKITVRMKDRKKPENPPDKTGKDSDLTVILHKYDGVTMKGLPGAEFAIYHGDGRFLKNVSTGDGGRVRLELPGPGTYIAVEIKAPQGYGPSPDEYQFTITGNEGTVKEIQIPNYPLSEKAGLITVHYDRNLKGTGNIFLKRKRLSPLAPAGDSGGRAGELILAVLFLCGTIMLWSRRSKRSREDKKE